MKPVYHILNGDCLAGIFPSEISGERIVWRECLVDGPLPEHDFFEGRATFLKHNYEIDDPNYRGMVIDEFKRIQEIEDNAEVYFWFEDDLFCQVNFWFLINSVKKKKIDCLRVFPNKGEIYFSQNESELIQNFKNSKLISSQNRAEIEKLWTAFQSKREIDLAEVSSIRNLHDLQCAIHDLNSRKLLNAIYSLSKTSEDFNVLFKRFQINFPIYGFGDLQFKSLLNKAKKKTD